MFGLNRIFANLAPQAANALKVQLVKAGYEPQEEMIFTAENKVEKISAEVSKRTALITFRDAQGNVIL